MANVSYELVIILVLAILNGIFAMSEVALLSARRSRLQHLADRGNTRARCALQLLQDPNSFLSTVQIGVTLVGVWAGAFGGATLAKQIAEYLDDYTGIAPYAESIGIAIVVVLITYISLIIGELVPKRIALNNPERVAAGVAKPMAAISRIVAPIVALLSVSTNAVLWLTRVKESKEPDVTQDDVRAMIRMGTQSGALEEGEQTIVERVFRFADRKATAIMTHRADIEWIDINDPPELIDRDVKNSRHTRLPVADGSLDEVLGILLVKDYFSRGQVPDLRSILRSPIYIPERMPALKVLEQFRNNPVQIALVIDEYGGIEGLVSATDVLEALVGELPVEGPGEQPVVQRPDGSWLIDGSVPADDLRELLGLDYLPGAELNAFETAAGFLIHHLGRIPKLADRFEFGDVRLEVVDMDGNRIDKILAIRIPNAQ